MDSEAGRVELLGCAHCGGKNLKSGFIRATDEVGWFFVECECGAQVHGPTAKNAQGLWNTRTPTPDNGLREALEQGERECQSVWRCAIGDVTGALDVLKNQWAGSRRKGEREAGAVLSGVLDLIWAARDPAARNYQQANENGKALISRARSALSQAPR